VAFVNMGGGVYMASVDGGLLRTRDQHAWGWCGHRLMWVGCTRGQWGHQRGIKGGCRVRGQQWGWSMWSRRHVIWICQTTFEFDRGDDEGHSSSPHWPVGGRVNQRGSTDESQNESVVRTILQRTSLGVAICEVLHIVAGCCVRFTPWDPS